MYSTCIFCHRELGANETLEEFPVGRRLAYDPERGRLWVVCRGCGRWNLSPLEERWEAIEAAERLFRDTRLRVSTANIGMARVGDGLELVRVGSALRTELAAWRYGGQFGKRLRRQVLYTGAGAAVAVGVAFGGPAAGLITGGAVQGLNLLAQGVSRFYTTHRIVARVPAADGATVGVTPRNVREVRLVDGEAGWRLEVPYRAAFDAEPPGIRLWRMATMGLANASRLDATASLTGDEALRAAGVILPRINSYGGSRGKVRSAVDFLERAGDPLRCFAEARVVAGGVRGTRAKPAGSLGALPLPVRLALEMASHEESERRALEGELALLERQWREAEEIAAIADNLLLPAGVERFLQRHRGGRGGGAPGEPEVARGEPGA